MTTSNVKPFKKKHYLVMLFLFVLSFAVYGGTFYYQFVSFDDPDLAYENKEVRSFNLKQIFTSTVAEDYIPLTVASYAIDHALFGMDPSFFHLHNVLLHSLNVLLVFVLIYMVSQGGLAIATATALLFSIHPLHVESVAWVAERKDVLSGFFSLAAMIFYWRFLERERISFYALSIGCLALALFAKFMAVSVPAVFVLMEVLRREPVKKTFLRLMPFALLAGVFTYIHMSLHNSTSGAQPWSLLRGVDSLAFYLTKTFYPVNLSVFYEQTVVHVIWWEYLVAGLTILALGLAAVKFKKERPAILFGSSFFLLTIFPVLQIVPFGNLFVFGDRFMYLPSIGLFYALCVLIAVLVERRTQFQKQALVVLWSVGAVCLALLAYERTQVWQNSKTLWTAAVNSYPQSAVAHNNLGLVYLNAANRAQAIAEFIEAAQLRSDYTDPYVNLGLAYLDLKQLNEASAALNEALRINPKLPRAHVNMALILEAQNQFAQAGEHYVRALELDPDLIMARYNLGVIYYKLKQSDKALDTFRQTLERDPYLSEAHHGVGVILVESGQWDAAISEFQKAVELDPLFEAPRIQLISIYNKQGRTDLMAQEVEGLQRAQRELASQPPTRPKR
jgi:protein O-mannosyl-transferase